MEDDVHHFRVVLRHAEGKVTEVQGTAWRTPWTACPGAVAQLQALEGAPLETLRKLPAPVRYEQCLHLLDLALLAADHAHRSDFARDYRIEVDHDSAPPIARLWRDDVEILQWGIDGGRIRGSRFDGVAMSDLTHHVSTLPTEDAEAALLLRRASLISFVRRLDLDAVPDSNTVAAATPANCYAKQPGRRDHALRNYGSSRDFSGSGTWPLENGAARKDR
jgi:hypothetical protein